MPLETATYIVSLVITNPDGGDQKNTSDDHLRLLKACLKRTFPLLDGAVSLSHTQLMRLNDVSQSVQLQINNLRDGSATVHNALYANSASFAANANNALSLGGVPAATYARKDTANTFTSGLQLHAVGNTGGEQMRFAGSNADFMTWYNVAQTVQLGYIQVFEGGAMHIINPQATVGGINLVGAGTGPTWNFTNSIWHSGNDGANSGLNADLLDGLDATDAAIGSTMAARTPQGYIYATYFNQSSADNENPNVASVVVSAGDGFFRKATPSYLGSVMSTRNISNKAGTSKTLSSAAPSGGIDGDIWYRV